MAKDPKEMPRPVQAGWETISDGSEGYPDHTYDVNGFPHAVVSEREFGIVADLSLAHGIPGEDIRVYPRNPHASLDEIKKSVGMLARGLASHEP